jgi:hypothetical protein
VTDVGRPAVNKLYAALRRWLAGERFDCDLEDPKLDQTLAEGP